MKAIHYINQFFGQIGGEESANAAPSFHDSLVGCSAMLNQLMPDIEVTNTIICGDNYINEHTDEALAEILGWLENQEFDIFFAGPSFMAGRYGSGCGLVCKAIAEKFNVPVITSMNVENPGVELFHKDAYIFKGGRKATYMRQDMAAMATFAEKIAKGDTLLPAATEGYFGRGIRHQYFPDEARPASDRLFDMLMKKLRNEPFETELPIPKPDVIPIADEIKDLSSAKIVLITSGGIVPKGNPDRIQSASATKWGMYDISKMDRLEAGEFYTIHAGYDSEPANADPNRVLPLDALKEYEKEGRVGKVNDYYFATVGTGTTQGEASRMSHEIIEKLKEEAVDGAILVTT